MIPFIEGLDDTDFDSRFPCDDAGDGYYLVTVTRCVNDIFKVRASSIGEALRKAENGEARHLYVEESHRVPRDNWSVKTPNGDVVGP